jgi:hypothetical protein
VLAVGESYTTIIVLEYDPSISNFVGDFNHVALLNIFQGFSAPIEIIM